MPSGPLGGPRPFAESNTEIAIYFSEEIEDNIVGAVEHANLPALFEGPFSGPHGVQNNVVALTLSGNSTSMRGLSELQNRIEEATGLIVEDIEVII